jgi:hypothetical protein
MAAAGSRLQRALLLTLVSVVSFLLGSLGGQLGRVGELSVAAAARGAERALQLRAARGAKPALRLGYCAFEQSEQSDYDPREAEWVVSLVRGPLSAYYDVTVSTFCPEPEMLRKRGAALSPQDEWRALGLDLDIRVCFFGTTKVVQYMVARGGAVRRFLLPAVAQLRWTADGFVHWPHNVSFVADASGRRMGPLLVRANSEPWEQLAEGVEVHLDTKRAARCMPRAGVAIYQAYLVSHLGRRQRPLSPAPDFVPFRVTKILGCCVSPGAQALDDGATRSGFFDAAAELRLKTGFVAFLQTNCGSLSMPHVFIRHAFLYALHNATGKPITQLGGCPNNLDERESVARMGLSRAARQRNYDETRSAARNAVEVNRPFKFVVCFENTNLEGYLSEKVANAYLARSVPIYLGGGEGGSFLQALNPKALVRCELPPRDERFSEKSLQAMLLLTCPDYEALKTGPDPAELGRCLARVEVRLQEMLETAFRPCLEQVRALDSDDRAYMDMISQPLMPNGGQHSGPWNETHLAESLRLVYEALVTGSGRFDYRQSSWRGKPYGAFTFGDDALEVSATL